MVHLTTFTGQEDTQTAIPKPTTFIRQFTQSLSQSVIALFLLLILKDRPM